jgi:hypothetical protein
MPPKGKVRTEAEAVRMLVAEVEANRAELVTSEYRVFEVSQTPDVDRAHRVMTLLEPAKTTSKRLPTS